ncbi:glutamate--tRNA ligase family protein [Candidatus Carsonella ruddii]|uniref:Exodeoxyribonuclease V gamma chain RecC n=1 Tax=Carsonella ruddii TaxID=114186 RepID=A0A1U9RRG9_CARRU|nr:glutamate--tRNA ligase family protein [Candidatus Carsonella ruddii]AQU89504.1 Exodeoxyribonuclease V gamma chain RecC [Candidatus Carsonella ruddii]
MINKILTFSIKKSFFRFPPDPNGFLHIGHVFNILVNFFLSINKKGNFILRFDNTNLKNKNLFFYNFIIYDLLWLGIKWKKKKFFLNEIKNFYLILLFYFKNKKIYFKKKFFMIRINFNYLNYIKIINIFLFKNIFFKKNYFVFIIKKKIIFRIKKKNKHWNIFPTYDFSQSINDYFNKINISICTKEFENNIKIYNYLLKYIIKKPYQIEFSKKNFKKKKFSKRKLKKNLIFNIFYLRKIGFNVKNFYFLCNLIGISKKISFLNYKQFILSLKIENNYIEKCYLFVKNFIFNIKKNLIVSVFLNEKNINLTINNFLLNKIVKISLNKFNFLIFKKKLLFKKKIFLNKLIFFKSDFIIIKKIIKIIKANFNIKKKHCLYENILKFKKSILKIKKK